MHTKMASRLASAWAIFCVVALAVLAWTPGPYMIRTSILSGHEEHFLAYFLSACTILGAQRYTGKLSQIAVVLVLYAAVLEFGQLCVPGRHPALADFCASALGAAMGTIALPLYRVLARVLP
jgi:VanZ family protein